MAIKTLDNVKIDGVNQAFGGYIYALNYEANYGEQPSTLRVTVTNEAGIFNISPSDLYTIGAPAQISIGTKIVLYMYPMEYVIEESPKGKFLQIDYVDESLVYLDKQIVKLKSRGVAGESYPNTIVIGFESIINSAITTNIATLTKSTTLLGRSDPLRVPDVVYSFPMLLSALASQNILGSTVTLSAASSNYYQSYCGRLREVLSAWCNELALGFYWENRKLNFIDLSNPANLQAVVNLAATVRSTNSIATASTRYSIKDTFTRAVDGQFNKDGEWLQDTPPPDQSFTMNYLDLSPTGSTLLKNKMQGLSSKSDWESRVRAAYYGRDAFMAYVIQYCQSARSSGVSDYFSKMYRIYPLNAGNGGSDEPLMKRVLKNSNYSSVQNNYNWFYILCNFDASFDAIYNKYHAYAKAWGSFYYIKMAGDTTASALAGVIGDAIAYPEDTPLTNVGILHDVLDPLKSEIDNYSTITLGDFLAFNPYAIQGSGGISGSVTNVAVYVIKKTKPMWRPADNLSDNTGLSVGGKTTIGYFGDTIIVEGSGKDFQKSFSTSNGSVTYPLFYYGRQSGPNNLFSAITTPSTQPLSVSVPTTQVMFIKNYASKIEYENYAPPATANVSRYDLVKLPITEQQIMGAGFNYYQNGLLNKAKFNTVFSDLYSLTSIDQPGPFFSATYTIPNIDMVIPSLSIGQGLQGFSISISDNGIRTNYTLGTEKMRLRSPDVFIRYTYDNAYNRYKVFTMPSYTLVGKA